MNKPPVLQSNKSVPTSVYRYYDKNKILIYVGVTSTGITRNRQHNADKAWWRFVASQEIDHYSSRDAARFNEILLINRYRPPFNKQHNPDYKAINAYYLALVGHGPMPAMTLSDRVAQTKVIELAFVGSRPSDGTTILQFDAVVRDDLVAKALLHDKLKPAPVLDQSNRCFGKIARFESKGLMSRIDVRSRQIWEPQVRPLISYKGYIKPSKDGLYCQFKKLIFTFGGCDHQVVA